MSGILNEYMNHLSLSIDHRKAASKDFLGNENEHKNEGKGALKNRMYLSSAHLQY